MLFRSLIIVALYFWSAVQKMNATFLTRTWPDFIGGLASVYPGRTLLTQVGWIAPVTEAGIAIGLALRRSRVVAVVCAVTLHACTAAVLRSQARIERASELPRPV